LTPLRGHGTMLPPQRMKTPLLSILLGLAALIPVCAADALPVLQREILPNEEMWALETELMGQRERNGAVLECVADALCDLLRQAGMEPTVESLVLVLTAPCESGSPEAAVKELLMPRADRIRVSPDASFAVIATPVRGGTTLEIFRDTAHGLSVRRIRH